FWQALWRYLHSFRRTHFDGAGAGATVTRRTIHVLDIGLRQHIFAGRDRANHVGHGKYRLGVARAIDGRGETVIAEVGVRRLLAVLDPGQCSGVAGRDQMRVVDLEACRQVVRDDDVAVFRLRLGDLQHHRETIVLLCLRRIGRAAVERKIVAFDLEAVRCRGLRRDRGATDRNHRLYRRVTGVGDLDWLVVELGRLVAAVQGRLDRRSIDIERQVFIRQGAR